MMLNRLVREKQRRQTMDPRKRKKAIRSARLGVFGAFMSLLGAVMTLVATDKVSPRLEKIVIVCAVIGFFCAVSA